MSRSKMLAEIKEIAQNLLAAGTEYKGAVRRIIKLTESLSDEQDKQEPAEASDREAAHARAVVATAVASAKVQEAKQGEALDIAFGIGSYAPDVDRSAVVTSGGVQSFGVPKAG